MTDLPTTRLSCFLVVFITAVLVVIAPAVREASCHPSDSWSNCRHIR
jgi:hypothetical protein